jgi:hypothetical protein
MPSPNPLELLRDSIRVKEYAVLAGKSLAGAYLDVRRGIVPSVRAGTSIRIPRAALAEAIARTARGGCE